MFLIFAENHLLHFQGLTIFVLHCLRNEDVRKAFMKRYRMSLKNLGPFFTSISPTSSSTGGTYVKSASSNISSPGLSHKVRSAVKRYTFNSILICGIP